MKLHRLFSALLCLLLLLAGCGEPAAPAPSETPAAAPTAAPAPAQAEALPPPAEGVYVSEILASNSSYPDAAGGFPDWVELGNAAGEDRDLSGWGLSDSESRVKYRFPEGTVLPAGGFLRVNCEKNSPDPAAAPFSISKSGGETLILVDALDRVMDRAETLAMGKDRSMIPGAEGWVLCDRPTPGLENTEAGYLAWQEDQSVPAPLAIWELMSGNDAVLQQYGDEYYDWCELRNTGTEPLELAGWSLTDDPDEPGAFVLPAQTLRPGECLTVLLTDGDSVRGQLLCAPFALNALEDWLYLYAPDGTLADCLRAYGIPYRGSLGRMKGRCGSFYFETPTPGADNGPEGAHLLAQAPAAEAAPGVYEGVESVTVALSGAGDIRYTTDGSLPTADSPLYEAPLELTKTAVIRARCFAPERLPSQTATLNYVINEGHSLPVVCLSMAPGDFEGYNGIYTRTYSHFEVYANLSFFDPEGAGFSRDCGARLHGAGSRTHYEKKSMKVNFRPRYGGALDYDVFGDGAITGFDSLLLRGGNLLYGNVMLKDAMIAMAANAASDNVLCLNARFAVLYVNARYWGIYSIREAYSERYVADHLGGSEKDVTILQAPISSASEPELHDRLLHASRGADAETGYDWAASWLDLDNLADWMIFQAYFTNQDITGNVRYIRGGTDGRWRYGLFDLDESLYDDQPNWNFVCARDAQHGQIPAAMLKNPRFREQFLRRLSELLSDGLSAGTMTALLEGLMEQLAPEIDREAGRWGGRAYWDGSTAKFLATFQTRGERLARDLKRYLNLSNEEYAQYFGFFDAAE